MASDQEEYYEIPLLNQRVFGAGLKRRRVPFVPASVDVVATSSGDGAAVKRTYLDIVLGQQKDPSVVSSHDDQDRNGDTSWRGETRPVLATTSHTKPATSELCKVCHQPISDSSSDLSQPHESSLAHQVCLSHVHPPSALDRERQGLHILQTQGWDPDARLGLGATGEEGRLYPVRATEKLDRLGLGHHARREEAEEVGVPKREGRVKARKETAKLDAGKVRKREAEEKRKDAAMRREFYEREEVLQYLGQGS